MVFLETKGFTRRVIELLSDDEYRQLQQELMMRPDRGAVIPGSGGIRKVRWGAKKRGKRGGARFIYYWAKGRDQILMLFVFSKDESDDLTREQIKQLRSVVEEGYK